MHRSSVELSGSMIIGRAFALSPMKPATMMFGLILVPPIFLQLWMNLIFSCSTPWMMQSWSLVMALIFLFFDFVLPQCIDEHAKVAVGCVGCAQGSKVRLPAVETHCIAAFIFLF